MRVIRAQRLAEALRRDMAPVLAAHPLYIAVLDQLRLKRLIAVLVYIGALTVLIAGSTAAALYAGTEHSDLARWTALVAAVITFIVVAGREFRVRPVARGRDIRWLHDEILRSYDVEVIAVTLRGAEVGPGTQLLDARGRLNGPAFKDLYPELSSAQSLLTRWAIEDRLHVG